MVIDSNDAKWRKFDDFCVKHHSDALKSTSIVTRYTKFWVFRVAKKIPVVSGSAATLYNLIEADFKYGTNLCIFLLLTL